MHPAFSVIFFTVSSGAGFGLFALLYLADALKLGGGLSTMQVTVGGVVALALIIGGLLSSVLHLANPKNAWRAFSRWRTSWLSREGVFSLAFFPFAFGYVGLSFLDMGLDGLRLTLGAVATLLAWITVFSTSMIYGCLKTIRQWNTPLVPANYLALGHFSGALILMLVALSGATELTPYFYTALMLLVVAAVLKAIYFFWVVSPNVASTINTATGFTRAQVKLFDAGHTHGTFLTQEFGFQVARKYAVLLKIFLFAAAFVAPLALLLASSGKPSLTTGVAMVVLVALGLIAERWLFFAEARHVVNLYHGTQRC